MSDDKQKGWAEDPRTSQRILYGLTAICVVLFFSDLLYHKHAHFSFEETIGFHGLFGFAAYVTIVNSAKLLRRIVTRPENYYDE
jgi:hypothetical protein